MSIDFGTFEEIIKKIYDDSRIIKNAVVSFNWYNSVFSLYHILGEKVSLYLIIISPEFLSVFQRIHLA